jgi:ATP-dependent Lon protease
MKPTETSRVHESMPRKGDKKKGFEPKRKRSGAPPPKDDDDSLDSKGNIRNLIDYEYDSEDEESFDFSEETGSSEFKKSRKSKSPIARRTRNALQKRKQQTKKQEKSSTSSSEDGSYLESLMKADSDLRRKLRNNSKEIETLREKKERSKKKSKKSSRKRSPETSEEESEEETESEEESEEEEDDSDDGTVDTEDEEEDENDEEDDEEYDSEEEESENGNMMGITFSFGGDEAADRMIPKRHNMKKEPADVKKFVKLVTKPSDEDTIDGQIDQFKALPEDKRKKLLDVLENRGKSAGSPQQNLMFKILTMNLPTETQSMVLGKYNSLQQLDPGSGEYFKVRNWLEKVTSMPLGLYKELPVKIEDGPDKCGSFMDRARKCLDEAIYGQEEAKLQVLQFIGTKIANPNGRGLSLLLAGPPGIGKTSLIKNGIAKALEWPFQFISLGGDSDASTYSGHQVVYEGSHCGKIVNSLCAAKSMTMVLMFDELDKISTTPKGEEVQNLLVHLTDPVQNGEFEDKYLSGIPIDLSKVMFTFSANDLGKIDRVLMDRMIVINLQGYSAKDKLAIAEHYLLPAALKEVGLAEKVGITKEVLQYVLENHASEESGVRELKRCIEQIAQKINMLRMFNTKDLPFHIKDFTLPFVVKKEHIDLFLKKKTVDESARHMYT